MVGREVLLRVDKSAAGHRGRRCSRSRTCTCRDDRGLEAVRGVSFDVRAGEIVGIAGVDGNGQTRADRRDHRPAQARRPGTITPRGRDIDARERARAPRRRAWATSRRTASAAASCSSSRSPRTSRCTTTGSRRTRASAGCAPAACSSARARLIEEFDVRGGGAADARRRRSRAATSRRSSSRARSTATRSVLIAAQPTRGLDVGAIEFVHRRLVDERDEGRAILLVSLELEEILSLSDRILVLYEGQIVGEYAPTSTEEELGLAMTGGGRARRRRVTRAPTPRAADRRRRRRGHAAEPRRRASALPARRRDRHAAAHDAARVLHRRPRRPRHDRQEPARRPTRRSSTAPG